MEIIKKQWLKSLTVKDIVILFLFLMQCFSWAFIAQIGSSIEKLNTENARLEEENERILHLLEMATEALERKNQTSPKERELRDPFRPEHPTREEAEEKKSL